MLAHGNAGVGVYQLPSPSALSHLETFVPGVAGIGGHSCGGNGHGNGHGQGKGGNQGSGSCGKIVSVAAAGQRLLVAAEESGAVYLYDLRNGRTLAATFQLPGGGKLERVRMRGRQLWVLTDHPEQVTVYDVGDPATPQLLGQFQNGAAEEFRARYAGVRRYSFGSNLVSVYRLEPVSP